MLRTIYDSRLPEKVLSQFSQGSGDSDISSEEEFFEVIDPATEKPLASILDTQHEHWLAALDNAVEAQASWAEFSPRQRSEILHDIFLSIKNHAEDYAITMTLEMGKPLSESYGEVSYGAEYFRWFAEEAVRLPGRIAEAPAGTGDILVTSTPVGPVLAITPWNFPLAMAARKIAPALAAGCPILVKPAEETPLTMILFQVLARDVLAKYGAPQELIQVLLTTQAANLSRTLMADSRLRKVTFTGSTAVGKILVKQSAEKLLRTSMELGGNAPFLVAEDANIDLAVNCALQAKMRNGGEACISANRFLVHESIAKEFTQRLTQRMSTFTLGHGLEEGTTLGPIITAAQRERIATLVSEAISAGATLHCGGQQSESAGFFYPATVLSNIPAQARIMEEEIFGPVATVTTFSTLEEGIEMANNTPFGLAAYAFSENVHTCRTMAKQLQAGMVGINKAAISDPAAPFGGIKESGFGREGGTEGIEEYLDTHYIAL